MVVSGIALATGLAVIGWTQWQAYQEANVATVGSRPSSSAPVSVSPSARPSVSASDGPSPETGTSSPSASSTPSEATYPVPRRVRIPDISVETRVVPVGIDENDALEVPDDVRLVGWYDLGVPPGADRGSAVLVAHRDSRTQGHGVFYDLGQLNVGDPVVVRNDAGERLRYTVVSRESILKKRLPYEELFAVDGPPRLTLISCGGYYDPDNGGYQDNVVVTAVPETSA